MSLSDQLLAAFAQYGLPVLFGVVLLGSAGAPVPGAVIVLAAGALVHQGELNPWWVIALSCAGAVLGDCLGYGIGRYGGRSLIRRVVRRMGGEDRLHRAEGMAARWGGGGIFLSRWLVTPLSALINLASGMAAYPFPRFVLFDVPGEILWTLEFVLFGVLLSDHIAVLVQLVGQVPWIVLGLVGAVVFGRALLRYLRRPTT